MTMSGVSDMGEGVGFCFAALRVRLLNLIATVIDFCTPPTEQGRGHPRSATVRVLATLRQFLREGTPWRSLKATADEAVFTILWPPSLQPGRCMRPGAVTG